MDFITIFQDGSSIDFNEEVLTECNLENLLTCIGRERRYSNVIDWTVLQHSMACGIATNALYPYNAPLIQYAYFHDLHEAVMRDFPSPLKKIIGKTFYDVENEIQNKILNYFNISVSKGDKELFVDIDSTMAFVEACRFHTVVKVEQMKELHEFSPEIVSVCSEASVKIEQAFENIFDTNDILNEDIVKMYKEVLTLHF